MKSCLREECNRAFRNQMFLGALIIGFLFSLINIAENIQRAAELSTLTLESIADGMQINKSCTGFSLFISWMALHPTGMGSNLFYFLMPVLAAIPYGWSYNQDRRSGYFNQIVTRCGKRNYFLGKFLAVFLSGGAVAALPMAGDLLLNAMILPDRAVYIYDMLLPVCDYSLAGELLYTNRWLYAILWCGMTFLWGGVFACMTFLPGTHLRFSALVVLSPFAILLGLDAVISALGQFFNTKFFSVHYLVRPGSTAYSPQWAVLTFLCAFFIVTAAVCYWRVTKHELE